MKFYHLFYGLKFLEVTDQITYQLPDSQIEEVKLLEMYEKQSEIYEIVEIFLGCPIDENRTQPVLTGSTTNWLRSLSLPKCAVLFACPFHKGYSDKLSNQPEFRQAQLSFIPPLSDNNSFCPFEPVYIFRLSNMIRQ